MNLLKNKNKFSGGALILQMFLAVCFMVWLFPVNVFAAETVDWSVIKNTVIGEFHDNGNDEASGNGWSYSNGTITIEEGTTVVGDVAPFGGVSSPEVNNIHSNGGIFNGTIVSGNFTGTLINEDRIEGGTFNGEVINNSDINSSRNAIFEGTVTNGSGGNINAGTFKGTVTNELGGSIQGGIFDEAVTNDGTIKNGTFKGTVTNEFGGKINSGTFTNAVTNNGRIYGGTFTNTVTNDSYIHNGTFEGTVTNMSFILSGIFNGAVMNKGNISSDGTFNETVTNEGIISKGRFNIIVNKVNGIVEQAPDVIYNQLINEGNGSNPNPNPGDDEGNTPPQNPGNNESNTSNSKDNADNDNEYVFVEPVVIVVPEGQKYVDDVMEQLATVPTNGKVVIDTKDWYCFNRTLAEKVTSMKDVTVTIKYMYQGKKYEVTIPAGSDVVSLLGETGFVGFRYLDTVYSGKEITE